MTYVKVYDASHMVGFDVPDVTNDMIMRFMGVDMNEFAGSTSIVGSVVGEDDDRPEVHVGKVKPAPGIPLLKGGKGDWESWYNAISAVLILLTLGGIVALYLYLRRRRRARSGPLHLPRGGSAERDDRDERVPLATAAEDYELEESSYGRDNDSGSSKGKGKGKEKARDSESDAERGETVFALGDEDEH
jgi:carboxypeptidase D